VTGLAPSRLDARQTPQAASLRDVYNQQQCGNFFACAFALVLMTVALDLALTAMRLAIHGREVAIPKVVGMGPAGSRGAGAASGLQV